MTHMPEILAGVSNYGKHNNKKLLLIVLSSFLLATISGVAASPKDSIHDTISTSHSILRSSCSSTRFPDLCFSSIASVPGLSTSLSTVKDVINASIKQTITFVQRAFFKIQNLSRLSGLTHQDKTALHDCLENMDQTLYELHLAEKDLKTYPANRSIPQYASDLMTMLSGSMTNQYTCLDALSYNKRLWSELVNRLMRVHHMCSNGLVMIRNMTDRDLIRPSFSKEERRVEEYGGRFPSWFSVGDRRLLQSSSSSVKANVVVAADGNGDYRTVSEAVAAAPERSSSRYVIRIKAGVYRENVEVPKEKTNLMFVGDGRKKTLITGSRNVGDGSTTFRSATVAIVGGGFLARDITFQNTAGPSKHQAVALRVGSDLSAFYQCNILGYQDTLYVHSLRQYYTTCLIAGTVDFIFGNAAVVFQYCDIHGRRPDSGQKNMVTAQGRDDPNQNTGITIQKCNIGATSDLLPVKSSFPTYLGRPWKEYSRTVVMETEISDVINPAGWFEWNGNFALDTLFYAEFANTGVGANTANRVKWKGYKVITNVTEALPFTVRELIAGYWLVNTGFPFTIDF